MTDTAPADRITDRPWRLRAYTGTTKASQKLVVDQTCRGDARLDAALKRVESRTDITRFTVEQQW